MNIILRFPHLSSLPGVMHTVYRVTVRLPLSRGIPGDDTLDCKRLHTSLKYPGDHLFLYISFIFLRYKELKKNADFSFIIKLFANLSGLDNVYIYEEKKWCRLRR